ncbi:antibiotic biosynthesis monooxygenase family protein [Streptomyces sp. NPDC047002]|uniref:putative quinol monooxygenase n=1 Tax=Streptomyces sp. NPDC047002 TaxID=3155475 RepID=UPI0034545994
MPELQVIARYTVAGGNEDEVLALLSDLAAASRAEPGNRAFVVYRQLDDPRGIVLLERYASREAFADHRETPHFRDLVLGRIVPLLDSRVVELYDAE